MLKLIAIDPGKNGGIATGYDKDRTGAATTCLPMFQTEGDIITFLKSFDNYERHEAVVYMENLVRYTGNNIPGSAMAVYASNWGFIKGAVQMAGFPLKLVTPQAWLKGLGLGKRQHDEPKTAWKNKLKAEAQRRFPKLDVTLKTADALLILSYAAMQEKVKLRM